MELNTDKTQTEGQKTLLVYVPMTYPTVSTRFLESFMDLLDVSIPGVKIIRKISKTFPLDRSRNEMADLATSNKYKADWILFVDGDNILPKDTIPRLLAHCSDEFPVVSGLYFRKVSPYVAVPGHYSDWKSHENIRKTIEGMGFVDKEGNQCLFYKPIKDFTTVQPVDVSGMGCLLVRTDVFKKLDLPYFAYFNPYSLGGDFSIHHSSEEMLFFCKLRKAGIKTLLDPTIRCGHEVFKVIGCPEE